MGWGGCFGTKRIGHLSFPEEVECIFLSLSLFLSRFPPFFFVVYPLSSHQRDVERVVDCIAGRSDLGLESGRVF